MFWVLICIAFVLALVCLILGRACVVLMRNRNSFVLEICKLEQQRVYDRHDYEVLKEQVDALQNRPLTRTIMTTSVEGTEATDANGNTFILGDFVIVDHLPSNDIFN